MAFGVDVEVPNTRVVLRQPDVIVNRSLIPIQPVAEFALSASYAQSASFLFGSIESASYATFALTASYVSGTVSDWDTLANKPQGLVSSSTQIINYNLLATTGSNIFTGTQIAPSFSGSLFGTASWAQYAVTASYVEGPAGITDWSEITNKPDGLVSSSAQINTGSFSGSFIGDGSGLTNIASTLTFSGSTGGDVLNLKTETLNILGSNGITTSITDNTVTVNLPAGTVTASSQIDYTQIQNQPTTIPTASYVEYSNVANKPTLISSSTQVTALLPTGTVSSSTQVDYTNIQNKPTTIATASYVEYNNVANKPTLVSASSQVSYTGLNNVPANIVSASSQVSYAGLSNIPAGIVSSSVQVTTLLPNGTVSSSTQVDFNTISNKPTLVSASSQVNFTGLSNIPAGIVSSSGQVIVLLPAGTVSSSTQINYNDIQNKPTTISTASYVEYSNVANKPTLVSASSQVDVTQTTNIATIATTGSNTFTGIQNISNTTNSINYTDGALIVAGGVGIGKDVNISGSLNVIGLLTAISMSTQYVTSSQYTIGTSRIILNDDDLIRFAGISIVDSGSTSTTASIFWDSLNHKFIYENLSGSTYNSAMFIGGPRNYGALGSEVGLTNFRVPVAHGDDHIDSRIESSSIRVDFPTRLTHIEAGLYVTGSITASGNINGTLIGTSSWASNAIFANTASYIEYNNIANKPTLVSSSTQVTALLPTGTVSSSAQVSYTGLSNIPSGIVSSSGQVTALLPTGTVSSSAQISYTGLSNIPSDIVSSSAQVIALLPTGTVSSSTQINTGSFTGSFTGSLFGTSSWAQNAISSSFATTASYALNAGGSGFPFSGSAVITGSLLISGSGLTVTGSTNIQGAFTATTKSFLINHQRLLGKKLVYGVVEAPEHSVLVRGKLEGSTTIVLPEEWEWLVDMNTITVHLTPIGTYQQLFVSRISGPEIHISIAGQWAQDVLCYYTVHATRKDVAPLETVV